MDELNHYLALVDIPGRKAKMKVVQMGYLIDDALQAYMQGDTQEMLQCLSRAKGWKEQTEAATPIFMHSFETKETLPIYLQEKLEYVHRPQDLRSPPKYDVGYE